MSKISKLELKQAAKAAQINMLEERLRLSKNQFKNPKRSLEEVFQGKIDKERFDISSGWFALAHMLSHNNSAQKKLYMPYFRQILARFPKRKLEKLMSDDIAIKMIKRIIKHRHAWQRDPDSWRPRGYTAQKMVLELVHYLFARFPVPTFMNQAWVNLHDDPIKWFIHIGSGGNLRHAVLLPMKLTKKMAHYCLQGHSSLSIYQALRRGQVLGLGGSKQLVRKILKSRIGDNLENEKFWTSLIQFLINHQQEENLPVQKIIEYVHLQKYGLPEEEQYGHVSIPAENEAFEMKGRSLSALLKSVEERFQDNRILKINFKQANVNPYLWKDDAEHPTRIIRISPIQNSFELVEEGRRMKHCVGSYLRYCLDGYTSIWSMTEQKNGSTPRRLLTIQLDLEEDKWVVYQIRGKCNRSAKPEENKFIQEWVQQNEMTISTF